ncbi:MAG: 3-isopropylmalate dehydratase large subunit [candidate division WOR-3 bacterium]|nr:MAG: 3-isopropylmalate dehydratase large subunit [candidate division WOR-3 bacterium]
MAQTLIEKILTRHSGTRAFAGDIVEFEVDARLARDFGGASVVKNIEQNGLGIRDPSRTFFTFDCNPTGSDQRYAENQQLCRVFARTHGIKVYDIDKGIGTHLAIDQGLVGPAETLVSTDSHANIVGAVGALGQGMGDRDIAYAFAHGKVWFEVPPTVKLTLAGMPAREAEPKDVVLALLRRFGAHGLLGAAVELCGDYVDTLSLDGRITISSMATEMGAIAIIIRPSREVVDYCRERTDRELPELDPDPDAGYKDVLTVDISGLEPMAARPGHPDDVVLVSEVAGRRIDSAFIGSCTNGRIEDLRSAAEVLEGRELAPGVVLKVVPATDAIWRQALAQGLVEVFKQAGALFGNAGCAGCAAGQVGQNGPGEVTVSTGNRNFPGKQGKGEVYLASPATAAASAIAGAICTAANIPSEPVVHPSAAAEPARTSGPSPVTTEPKPTVLSGRVWVIDQDNIDTDMIYHNQHLAVTDVKEMGRYAFGNLDGWQDFAGKAKQGDIIVTGRNFGAGSSRQHAVDCFRSLGVGLIIARSFGAIYFRNAVNAGMPVMVADVVESGLRNGDQVEVDLASGTIKVTGTSRAFKGTPFSDVQMGIYQRGDLLASRVG